MKFLSFKICLICLILSISLVQSKSIPFDERELNKLTDCKKPIRTNGQFVLNPPKRRKFTFTQLLLKQMFGKMIRRKHSISGTIKPSNSNLHPGLSSIQHKRRQRKPIRPRKPVFDSSSIKI